MRNVLGGNPPNFFKSFVTVALYILGMALVGIGGLVDFLAEMDKEPPFFAMSAIVLVSLVFEAMPTVFVAMLLSKNPGLTKTVFKVPLYAYVAVGVYYAVFLTAQSALPTFHSQVSSAISVFPALGGAVLFYGLQFAVQVLAVMWMSTCDDECRNKIGIVVNHPLILLFPVFWYLNALLRLSFYNLYMVGIFHGNRLELETSWYFFSSILLLLTIVCISAGITVYENVEMPHRKLKLLALFWVAPFLLNFLSTLLIFP